MEERLDSPHARRWLDALSGEIELMKQLPSRETGLIDTGFAYEKRDWFDGVTALLREGREAGDPSMMYLYGRYWHFTFHGAQILEDIYYEWELAERLLGKTLDRYEPADVRPKARERIGELFQEAARAGSPRAALWRAYEYGDDEVPPGQRKLPESLEFPKLQLLKDAWVDLSRQCDEAGFMEESAADGHPDGLPDPGQTSLRLRLYELAMYSLNLGINRIGAEGELDCDGWTGGPRAFGAYVKKTNEDLESWYRSRR